MYRDGISADYLKRITPWFLAGTRMNFFQILLYSFKSRQSWEFVWLHFRYSIKASPFHSQQ